ncbi:GGDEF domain-containing protein [Vreelandella sp. V005]|uniref:GGDEF domain-containing protein n=1 Tax=Vreelandella sp. V005 TaxID=3459608 RepID=UPI004044FCB4
MDRSLHHRTSPLVTAKCLFHITRWKLVSCFLGIFFASSLLTGLSANNYYQRINTNYTSLADEILRAQLAVPSLHIPLDEGNNELRKEDIEHLHNATTLALQNLSRIQYLISQHQRLSSDINYIFEHFTNLNERLSHLKKQVEATQNSTLLITSLQNNASSIEINLNWLYNRLIDEVHHFSNHQQLMVQRIISAVIILLILFFSTTAVLSLAVFHLQKQRYQLQKLILIDELTGLYNRRHIVKVAFAALTQSRRDHTPLSLLLLDLDFFKRINDTYGHPVGDEVLRQVSERLRQFSRPSDTLARIGGEEFCLLMPATLTHDALQVAERLRREIESIEIEGLALSSELTVSIGVTTSKGGEHTFEQLYYLADQALYQAKSLGRNRVESILPSATPSPDNNENVCAPPFANHSSTFIAHH